VEGDDAADDFGTCFFETYSCPVGGVLGGTFAFVEGG